MSSTEIALVDQSSTIDVGKWAETLIFAAQLAEKVHDTEFVSKALRGKPDAVAATIMYGAEIGVTPMQALAGIHIVEGRPAPSSELMRAMILKAGHTITVHEATGTRVRVSGLRRGRPEAERVVVEWTSDMARAAGLLGKTNWRNYPRAMLMARASGDLARILFPDVVKGLGYVAEETAQDTPGIWGPPEVLPEEAPPRKALQRKPRARKETQAPTAPPTRVALEDTPLPAMPEPPQQSLAPENTQEETDNQARSPVAPPVAAMRSQVASSRPESDQEELSQVVAEKPSQSPTSYAETDDPLTPVSLPELEPERPSPPEPPSVGAGPQLISPAPLKALNTLLTRELGTAATGAERHAMLAAILGHPVHSTKDLTRAEGIKALAYMDRFAAEEFRWSFDLATSTPEDPVVVIQDLREPPQEQG
jgi:hypothetical protein